MSSFGTGLTLGCSYTPRLLISLACLPAQLWANLLHALPRDRKDVLSGFDMVLLYRMYYGFVHLTRAEHTLLLSSISFQTCQALKDAGIRAAVTRTFRRNRAATPHRLRHLHA